MQQNDAVAHIFCQGSIQQTPWIKDKTIGLSKEILKKIQITSKKKKKIQIQKDNYIHVAYVESADDKIFNFKSKKLKLPPLARFPTEMRKNTHDPIFALHNKN